MKKRTLVLLVGALCAASVAVGAAAESAAKEYHRYHRSRVERKYNKESKESDKKTNTIKPEKPAESLPDKATLITKEEAHAKALERAGLSAESVNRIKSELDYEWGVWKYEVEFRHQGFEYEVDINAETGEVTKFEKEFDD